MTHNRFGESYRNILGYFWPECITAFVLYAFLSFFDSIMIAQLQETAIYSTLGIASTLMNWLTKLAEAFSVGTVVLCGHYNGKGQVKQVGHSALSSLILTSTIGLVISSAIFFGASAIFDWYHVDQVISHYGIPYLQIRAVSIFFMFAYFALVGFLRGIKNTRAPMIFFVIGALVFVCSDWILIFGKFGFTARQLQGSAIASLLQYCSMFVAALMYIVFSPDMRRYMIGKFNGFRIRDTYELLQLSWPVMIDKSAMAIAKMWLARMIAPTGTIAIASFTALKDLEQLAFVPAIAFGQVMTFLVSNDFGKGNWSGVKDNIKKILTLSLITVATILILFCWKTKTVLGIFDKKGEFVDFAAQAFPLLSSLVVFDLIQLIFAAALRGAGDVKTVMMVRVVTMMVFFFPSSWLFAQLPLENTMIKFILVYSTFYFMGAIMSFLYMKRLAGNRWYQRILRSEN